MTRSLTCVFALVMFSSFLIAQLNRAENCDLSVRIRTNDERSVEGQIRVVLFSSQGQLAAVNIQGGEPAQFRVANGRTYYLTVSGGSIQTTTSSYFQINNLEPSHTETVHVKLENQKQSEESTSESPTISVSELNIPKNARREMGKGLDAYSKGDMEKASAYFEKAVSYYPGYARAYDMLGVIAIKSSDRTRARELFSKAIQVDNTFLPAYVDVARMDVNDENYAEAESLLAKVISVNSLMADAVALHATMEFAKKEYDKALVDVQRTHTLRNHEQFAEVHIMAGKVLRMQNHLTAAIMEFQLFLIEKPDSPLVNSVREEIASTEKLRDIHNK